MEIGKDVKDVMKASVFAIFGKNTGDGAQRMDPRRY
jgi:hypothetical protein